MIPESIQPRVFRTPELVEPAPVRVRSTTSDLDQGLADASVLPPAAELHSIASQLGMDGSSEFTGIGSSGHGEVTTHLSPAEFKAFLADGGVLRPSQGSHGAVVASLDPAADTGAPFVVEYNLNPGVTYHAEGDHFLVDGNIRDGRQMNVTYAGPNPAAPELPVDWMQGVRELPASSKTAAEPEAPVAPEPNLSDVARHIRDGVNSRQSRKVPMELWPEVRRKLELISHVKDFRELGNTPGNNLEKLNPPFTGLWSIRVNKQYRITFTVEHGRPNNVQVLDYHE